MPKFKLSVPLLPVFGILLIVGWVVYFYTACRYQLLFMEQQELFLYTRTYLIDYLQQPGGVTGYIGAFLLQFFYHPLVGAAILGLSGGALFLLLNRSVKSVVRPELAFLLAFFPPLLLFTLQHDHALLPSMAVSLLFSLAGVRLGFAVKHRVSRIAVRGVILLFLLFVGGVSVWIPLLAFVVDEVRISQPKRFAGPMIWLAGLVLLFWVLLSRLYLTWLPSDLLLANLTLRGGIPFFLPLLLLLWFTSLALVLLPLILPDRIALAEERHHAAGYRQAGPFLLIAVLAFWAVKWVGNRNTEQILHIDHAVMMQDWPEALELCKAYPEPHSVVWQYANLSLFMQGRLLDDFLSFSSSDFDPLFLPFTPNNLIPLFGQEVYYQMGLMNESVRWAFEASVANPQGTQSRLLRRLAQANLVNRKYEVAGKYLTLLEQSLYYRRWARQMKLSLSDTLSDNLVWVKSKRDLLPQEDFFSRGHPILFLEDYVALQPGNKMAFEYLMAYFLLTKDLKAVMDYMPQLFNHNYAKFPSLLAQVVVLYLATHPQDADLIKSYPVPSDVFKQFELFHSVLRTHQANPEVAKAMLKKDFGNTVWYYLQFDNSLEKKMQPNDKELIY